MSTEAELKEEFDTMMIELECNLIRVNFREKSVATEWISKLKASGTTLEEMQVRNDFLEYLVECTKGRHLMAPFCAIPPANESLSSLIKILPARMRRRSKVLKSAGDDSLIKDIFEQAQDNGEFLSLQPVPIDGTFVVQIIKNECN